METTYRDAPWQDVCQCRPEHLPEIDEDAADWESSLRGQPARISAYPLTVREREQYAHLFTCLGLLYRELNHKRIVCEHLVAWG